jgi:hypothetical protein
MTLVQHNSYHIGTKLCIWFSPLRTCISFHSLSYSHILAALNNTGLFLAVWSTVVAIYYQLHQSNPIDWVMAKSALHTLTGPNNSHFGTLLSWRAAINVSAVGGNPSIDLPFLVKKCFRNALTVSLQLLRPYIKMTNLSRSGKKGSISQGVEDS